MKHLVLTTFLFLFSLQLFAQERFDYQFFHLGVQYLFEDLTADSEFESPLLGMHLTVDDAHPDERGPLAAYTSLDEIVENSRASFKLVPSFAGQEVQQFNGLTTMTMGEGQESVIIRNNATVGGSWMATSLVLARVDSVREEVFRTFTDSVKYVSFALAADGSSVAATIRISKNHGLLTSVFFRELMEPQTAMPRWLVITPEEDRQLPVLNNVLDIPEGTILDIERVQDAYQDQAGDYIYIAKQHELTVGAFQQDTASGIWEQDFTYDEFRFTVKNNVREEAYDLSFTENLTGRYRLTEQRHDWLNAQPGAVVITEASGSNGDTARVLVYLEDFSCFGLGKRRSDYLFQTADGVWAVNGLREGVRSGYYFQQLGGPYFTVGALSQNLNDLEATLAPDGAVCGEPFDFSFFDPVVLGQAFDWQLFRPGVQYLYEKPGFDEPEYLGMKLTGNGEEAVYESIRGGEDINCRQRVPSFAGVRIRQEPALTTLLFYSDSLHLRPGAQIGESWMANDTTLATIDTVLMETFFGIADSVKHFSFKHALTGATIGSTISLSKNYGLLIATYFYDLASSESLPLAGLSNPEVGLQAPSFKSLTNFSPGDVYHTRIINTIEDMDRVYYQTVETQATVLDVSKIGDSLVAVRIMKNELTYNGTSPSLNLSDSVYRENRRETVVYDLREQPWMGGQASQNFPGIGNYSNLIQVYPGGCLGTNLLLDLHKQSDETCYSWMSGLIGHNGIYLNQVAGPFDQSVEGSHVINRLLYFNNTTCSDGTPLNFNGLIDGVNDFRPDERIRLYPNPSDGQVNLEVPLDLGPVALSVFSITGQRLLTFGPATGDRAVSLGPLPHGTYTVVFYNATGPVGRRRVVLSE